MGNRNPRADALCRGIEGRSLSDQVIHFPCRAVVPRGALGREEVGFQTMRQNDRVRLERFESREARAHPASRGSGS